MAKKQFKAESKRLLDLMINSIYTHKEIFLREIVSNASDAIDKLAYQALTDEKVGLNRSDFEIRIKVDKDAGTLTVSDNGIGMSREEMEENLGTICRSGSLKFKQEMEKQDELDIIGQFGVGFYSAFMVADEVTVISKKYGSDEAYQWQSSGADGYTMQPAERTGAGTDVIMKLKADTEDEKYSRYLESYVLQGLVKKYSDYIRYPIRMNVETQRLKEGTENSDKPEYETVLEDRTLNSMEPIWQKAKKDVTEAEYNDFYKEKFYDFEDPIATIHASVEGAVTYKALLYIPAKAPYDFYTKDFKKGLQLYSSGVLRLAAQRVQLALKRGDLRGDDRARALIRAAAQNDALELRRKVGDGVHVPAADVARERREVAGDLRVQRRLIGEAGGGAVGIAELLELVGQLGDARLARLRVAAEIAGRDRLARRHARALARGQDRDLIRRLDHGLVAHDEAHRVIPRPRLVLHDRRRRQRLMDGGRNAVAEIGDDRGKQDG